MWSTAVWITTSQPLLEKTPSCIGSRRSLIPSLAALSMARPVMRRIDSPMDTGRYLPCRWRRPMVLQVANMSRTPSGSVPDMRAPFAQLVNDPNRASSSISRSIRWRLRQPDGPGAERRGAVRMAHLMVSLSSGIGAVACRCAAKRPRSSSDSAPVVGCTGASMSRVRE